MESEQSQKLVTAKIVTEGLHTLLSSLLVQAGVDFRKEALQETERKE